MILKTKDSQAARIQSLRRAAAAAQTSYERSRAEKELALTLSGVDGEAEAAYYIDFHLKDSHNWMVIHDLRLERGGRVAQIDHLLINRVLEMYVVESKNLKTKVRYENGGWERTNGRAWEGFPCPIEQNRRHILVLRQLVEEEQFAPKRLGISLSPSYSNVVVVNPACSIVGEFPEDARVWKMDGLVRRLLEDMRNPLALLSLVAPETLEAYARRLLACHCGAPDQRGESAMEVRDAPRKSHGERCDKCECCGGEVTKAESGFCRMNKARFAGRLLCRKCQDFAPGRSGKEEVNVGAAARCGECGANVDGKVVAFCRFNSKRFNQRLLCRECQTNA